MLTKTEIEAEHYKDFNEPYISLMLKRAEIYYTAFPDGFNELNIHLSKEQARSIIAQLEYTLQDMDITEKEGK